MSRLSGWIWIALAGTVLQVVSLGTNFYRTTNAEGETQARDAWFGIAHTSELILATAIVTVALAVLMAVGRSPLRGRRAGLVVGVLGTVASLQVGYRMVAPPFDFGELGASVTMVDLFNSCLGYCSPAAAGDAEVLPGMWMALAGCVLVALGGYLHATSRRAAAVEPNFWRAEEQGGLTPWLTVAGAGALGQFVFGYTVFTFYVVNRPDGSSTAWAGWFPTPHTSVMVLWSTVLVLTLVVLAARLRAPMTPSTLGAVVAVLGFFSGSRIAYRMADAPFGGGGGAVDYDIGLGALLALASAVLVVAAGIVQAVTHRSEVTATAGAGQQASPA